MRGTASCTRKAGSARRRHGASTRCPRPSGATPSSIRSFARTTRMSAEPEWDRLTTATFPRDLLTWSHCSIEPPPNATLLHVATLNFEYSYFAPSAEKEVTEQTLLRRMQAFGTSIIEHDARLSGVEETAAALEERLTAIEGIIERRSERLRDLEETVDERTGRLLALESGAEEQQLRIGGREAPNAVLDQLFNQLALPFKSQRGRLASSVVTLMDQFVRLDVIQ